MEWIPAHTKMLNFPSKSQIDCGVLNTLDLHRDAPVINNRQHIGSFNEELDPTVRNSNLRSTLVCLMV